MNTRRNTKGASKCVHAAVMVFGSLVVPVGHAQESAWQKSAPSTETTRSQSPSQNNHDRRIRISRAAELIKIDGRLDERAWSQAEAVADFRQQEPHEGEPATERTEVRLMFDDKNFYVGIQAFD